MQFGKEVSMRLVHDEGAWHVLATSLNGLESIVSHGESITEAMASAALHIAEWQSR
jgi:predicted RNase H-like HicB family nuclease